MVRRASILQVLHFCRCKLASFLAQGRLETLCSVDVSNLTQRSFDGILCSHSSCYLINSVFFVLIIYVNVIGKLGKV